MHAYYAGDQKPLHPTVGVTVPPETFPGYYKNEAEEIVNDKYTWSKAPRYAGEPMEVGPLARVLVSYMSGNPEIVAGVNAVLTGLNLPVAPASIVSLNSALGRLAARPIEASAVAGYMIDWCGELVELLGLIEAGAVEGNPCSRSASVTRPGRGLLEAPRGVSTHRDHRGLVIALPGGRPHHVNHLPQ